mmetsp:Transcript_3099/g.4623  ORF Transcript_3099/g.4623 Transcript_3099/m.4623 type:complete len:898 (+) Transcript_3099:42-2735(+)
MQEGRNELVIEALEAKDLRRKKETKRISSYFKVIVLDGKERKKEKTDVVKNNPKPEWNSRLSFLKIVSDTPEVTFKVAEYSFGGRSNTLGECKLDLTQFDPRGHSRVIWLKLSPRSVGSVHVGITWKSPELARIQEEERKRRAEERRKMLARAWKDVKEYVKNFVDEEKKIVEEDKKAGPMGLETARETISSVHDFLTDFSKRVDRHPKFFQGKLEPLLESAGPIIVEMCMNTFTALEKMEQKDFKSFLVLLSKFENVWQRWGGNINKETHIMKLPIIRRFCVNCRDNLRSVIENVFNQVTHEQPVEKDDGSIHCMGPRDLFGVLQHHVGGLLPHIKGVAVLELAHFETRLLLYFQQLFRDKLRCIHFHQVDSKRRSSTNQHRKRHGNRFGLWKSHTLEPEMVILEFGEILRPKSGAASPLVKQGEGGVKLKIHGDHATFVLDEDFLAAVIGSCRKYRENTRAMFEEFEKQMLADTEFDCKNKEHDMKTTLSEMRVKAYQGFKGVARAAASVLADFWAREVAKTTFGNLFTKEWLSSSHLEMDSKSRNPQAKEHPCSGMVKWWETVLAEFKPAIAWEQGSAYLSTALLYASFDLYVRNLVSKIVKTEQSAASKFFSSLVGKKKANQCNRICAAMYEDLNWIRKQLIKRKRKFGIVDMKEALTAFDVLETVGSFLSVRQEDELMVDVQFPKLLKRIGIFARTIVTGLTRMKSDWNKVTKTKVLGRFTMYEQAIGCYEGSPLLPGDPVEDAEDKKGLVLDSIQDMATLCECLRGLDVIHTAVCEVNRRPAVLVAKKNKSTPWFGLTLLLYTNKTTKRVSALRAGRAMTTKGIDMRLKQECERLEKLLTQPPYVSSASARDGSSPASPLSLLRSKSSNSLVARGGDQQPMDVVTLEDFLS